MNVSSVLEYMLVPSDIHCDDKLTVSVAQHDDWFASHALQAVSAWYYVIKSF